MEPKPFKNTDIVLAIFLRHLEGPRFLVFVQERMEPGILQGLWEFPGGKIEKGESPRQALERECREELGLPKIERAVLMTTFGYSYPDRALTFFCYLTDGESLWQHFNSGHSRGEYETHNHGKLDKLSSKQTEEVIERLVSPWYELDVTKMDAVEALLPHIPPANIGLWKMLRQYLHDNIFAGQKSEVLQRLKMMYSAEGPMPELD